MDNTAQEVIEFYASLENISSINIWKINNEIKYTELTEAKTQESVIAERKALNLNFNNGILVSNTQLTDESGKIENSLYFTKDEVKYFESRLKQTLNYFLKSRYANILWQETKNNIYAILAIDSYIDAVNNPHANDINDDLQIIRAIIYISKSTKKRTDNVKKFIFNFLDNTENFNKGLTLDIILQSNFFKKDEIFSISNDVEKWLDKDNYFLNKHTLETSLILFKKLGISNSNIYKLLADNEDSIISKHPDEKDFIRFTSVGQKAKYLKRANLTNEYNSTMNEFKKLKQKVQMNKISAELDEDHNIMFNKYLNRKAEAILKLSPEAILAFFACDESILVDPKENKSNSEKSINDSLKSLFTVSLFDINGNYKRLSDDEKLDNEIFNNYTISHNIKFYALFLRVFMMGIIRGKLNYYKVFSFFEHYSWFGQKYKLSAKGSQEDDNSTWLSMIAPGLHNFFSQFELSVLLNTNKINNYILSMDSLTLKFEGALRDFIRLTGGNTTVEKREQLQEQLLEELIENPKTKEYFSERDIALFKYTFTRNGLNIRNHVAHSFLHYSDYNLQSVSFVFFCLLRLGQYEINPNDNNTL